MKRTVTIGSSPLVTISDSRIVSSCEELPGAIELRLVHGTRCSREHRVGAQ